MNENVDLTKILKDCPKGWKFYSSILGDVTFSKIDNSDYPIRFLYFHKDGEEGYGNVSKEGLCYNFYNGECTINNGECTFFPSKDCRDWSKFTAPWYKKDKFDPKTLRPFDKVLVRDLLDKKWNCDLFSLISDDRLDYPYETISTCCAFCIPYNDETKHLVGTRDEAPEYYRYWED